jgi:acyl carrier protein
LLTVPAVLQAVAFAVPHATLGEDVAAAIILRDGQTVSAQELRRFAALHLVDFKVPRQIVFLKEIPKGPTGKIQRIGLADKLKPELDALKVHTDGGQAAQLTPLEEDTLFIWKDVLGSEQIGIQDDFLALGGDSIQASTILLRLNEKYGTGLLIGDFFSALTVSALARIIQEKINSSK